MSMNKSGKFLLAPLSIRIAGALIGSVGFFLIAFNMTIIGTALVGIGSLVIALGES